MATFRTTPGGSQIGRISDRYERRAKSVGRESARHRGRMAKILKKGLEDATQEQLYDRTTLKVTRDMFNSIRARFLGNVVQVGYFFGRGARHAKYRLNMIGRSKQDGHVLDMQPSVYIKKHCDRDIKRSERESMRAIRETK